MVGLLAFVTSWRLVGLPRPGAGWGGGPQSQGSLQSWAVAPLPLQDQGLGARAGRGGGGGLRGAGRGQARCGYFNLINDRTPLRVCFNNQDTLQRVDGMFAVDLHVSSEWAVSIKNVASPGYATASLEPAGHIPVPVGASLSWCLRVAHGRSGVGAGAGMGGTLAWVSPPK